MFAKRARYVSRISPPNDTKDARRLRRLSGCTVLGDVGGDDEVRRCSVTAAASSSPVPPSTVSIKNMPYPLSYSKLGCSLPCSSADTLGW